MEIPILFPEPTTEGDVEEYWFFCHRWLATDEDDHAIVRELLPKTADGRPIGDLKGKHNGFTTE